MLDNKGELACEVKAIPFSVFFYSRPALINTNNVKNNTGIP
jgi:hypothetical protein